MNKIRFCTLTILVMFAALSFGQPFSIECWNSINDFKSLDPQNKQNLLEKRLDKILLDFSRKETLIEEINALKAYVNSYALDHLTMPSDQVYSSECDDVSEILSIYYARLLVPKSSDYYKHTIIDCLGALELIKILPLHVVKTLTFIKSLWRYYLFSVVGQNLVSRITNDTDFNYSKYNPPSELSNVKESKSTIDKMSMVVNYYIRGEYWNNIGDTAKFKCQKYIKPLKQLEVTQGQYGDILGGIDRLRSKAIEEIRAVWHDLYNKVVDLFDVPDCFSEDPFKQSMLDCYILSNGGKVDTESKYKKKKAKKLKLSFSMHSNESRSPMASSWLNTTILCAGQAAVKQRGHTVEDYRIFVDYTLMQSFLLPCVSKHIENFRSDKFSEMDCRFKVLKFCDLRRKLRYFNKCNIPLLSLEPSLILGDKNLYYKFHSVIDTLDEIYKFCKKHSGNSKISLVLTSDDKNEDYAEDFKTQLISLDNHLKKSWKEFKIKADVFVQWQKISFSTKSKDNDEEIVKALADIEMKGEDITPVQCFALAAVTLFRANNIESKRSPKDLYNWLKISDCDNAFTSIAAKVSRGFRKLKPDTDTQIMEWSQARVDQFKANGLWGNNGPFGKHFRIFSDNHLSPSDLTRESDNFRAIEPLPHSGAMLDGNKLKQEYATIMLVVLRDVMIKANPMNSSIYSNGGSALSKYIVSVATKLQKPIDSNRSSYLPSVLTLINDIIRIDELGVCEKERSSFLKHINGALKNFRCSHAAVLGSPNKAVTINKPKANKAIFRNLKNNSPEFYDFYMCFHKSLNSMVESVGYNKRVRQCPRFIEFNMTVLSLPIDIGIDIESECINIDDTASDDGMMVSAMNSLSINQKRTNLCLLEDFINGTSNHLAVKLTSDIPKETTDLVSESDKELLMKHEEKQFESLKNIFIVLNKEYSDETKRKKHMRTLEKMLSELPGDNWATKPMKLMSHGIAKVLKTGYNVSNTLPTYLNAGVLTLMIMNRFNQLREGKILEFFNSSSQELFDLLPGLRSVKDAFRSGLSSGVTQATAGIDPVQNLTEYIEQLNQTSTEIRNFGFHNAGTASEFVKTPGSNSSGWIAVNVFTSIYVSLIGIISVMNGIITQYQTFDKLTESEQLSLINGQLDIPTVEEVLARASTPDGAKNDCLYMPDWTDTAKDAGSHFIHFNAHLKRCIRRVLCYFTSDNSMFGHVVSSALSMPTGILGATFSQSCHTRIHSHKGLVECSKDAQIDRMVASFIKLAFFDTTKTFIDTRIPDSINFMMGTALLILDLPIATMAKSTLVRGVIVQTQQGAANDSLRDYWENNGESVHTASYETLGKVFGNSNNGCKRCIGKEKVRPIERFSRMGFDGDSFSEAWLSTLGTTLKIAHAGFMFYNLFHFVYNPLLQLAGSTGQFISDKITGKVVKSLSRQSGPHSEIDKDIHTVNALRKAADNVGWLSGVSLKFLITGASKVTDNVAIACNVHSSLAAHHRRGLNWVSIIDMFAGSLKDASTGAINRLAISSGNKPLQTFTGAADQIDTPIKEACTSSALHRNLTTLSSAMSNFAYVAFRKKVINALLSDRPLTESLDEECAALSSTLLTLGFEGAIRVSKAIALAMVVDLSNLKSRIKRPSTKCCKNLPSVIKKAKNKLSKKTKGFMQDFDNETKVYPTNSDEDKSIVSLEVYVEALSDVMESGENYQLKRLEVLQLFDLMSQHKNNFLAYLRKQKQVQNIRNESQLLTPEDACIILQEEETPVFNEKITTYL